VLDCSCAGALLPHFVNSNILNDSMMFSEREMQNKAPRHPDGSAAFRAAYDGDDVYGFGSGLSYGSSYAGGGRPGTGQQQQQQQQGQGQGKHLAERGSKSQGVVQEFYSTIEGNIVVLAACQANQILPMNPLYPADVFTSCLTTPIPIALRWFILQTPFSMRDIDPALSENIPGKENDRKTPKGELNWIFTAITDTIAWTTLPSTTFQKIFRQDLLVASLFRNFLLAKRIMKSFQCTPQSWPPLPDSTSHPLWDAWDLAAEKCLMHVSYMQQGAMMVEGRNNVPLSPKGGGGTGAPPPPPPPPPAAAASGNATFAAPTGNNSGDVAAAAAAAAAAPSSLMMNHSSFFTDNLTAFGMWLDFGGGHMADDVPMHLPILLQVLLSQTHRLHALVLLRRYLALGPRAVNLSLLVGIFPYVLKLLQSPTTEIRQVLVCVWACIIGFDSTCRMELVRDKNQSYFMQYLTGAENPAPQRCAAAFVLAELCNNYRDGQQAALQQGLQRSCVQILSQPEVQQSPMLKRWVCLCIFKFCEDFGWSKYVCIAENGHAQLYPLLEDPDPTVRASAVLALGEMFGASDPGNLAADGGMNNPGAGGNGSPFGAGSESAGGTEQLQTLRESEQELAIQILESCTDGSVIVRKEALIALSKFMSISAHASCMALVASEMMRLRSRSRSDSTDSTSSASPGDEPPSGAVPWILSAKHTRAITDTVAKHLSGSSLFSQSPTAASASAAGRGSGSDDGGNNGNNKGGGESPQARRVPSRTGSGEMHSLAPPAAGVVSTGSGDNNGGHNDKAGGGLSSSVLASTVPGSLATSNTDSAGANSSAAATSTTEQQQQQQEGNDNPQYQQQLPLRSRNTLLAAGYVGLWLALFEVHGKDPHPEIRYAAAAIVNWIHDSLPGRKSQPSSSASSNPNLHTLSPSSSSRSGGAGWGTPPRGGLGGSSPMRPLAEDGSSGSLGNEQGLAPSLSTMGVVSFSQEKGRRSPFGRMSPKATVPTLEQMAGAAPPLEPPSDLCLRSHLYVPLSAFLLSCSPINIAL
jgi:hypothetical protein